MGAKYRKTVVFSYISLYIVRISQDIWGLVCHCLVGCHSVHCVGSLIGYRLSLVVVNSLMSYYPPLPYPALTCLICFYPPLPCLTLPQLLLTSPSLPYPSSSGVNLPFPSLGCLICGEPPFSCLMLLNCSYPPLSPSLMLPYLLLISPSLPYRSSSSVNLSFPALPCIICC